jgi:hypothetical protein
LIEALPLTKSKKRHSRGRANFSQKVRYKASVTVKKLTPSRAISAPFLRASSRTIERKKEASLMANSAVPPVQSPDRKGLDATIAEFVYRYDGNILRFKQHQAGVEAAQVAHRARCRIKSRVSPICQAVSAWQRESTFAARFDSGA